MRTRLCFVVMVLMFALLLSACGSSSSSAPESSGNQSSDDSGSSAPASEASDYPTKPIDMLVAFSPGGSTDTVARIVANKVSDEWGKPINVVNKSGGSGTVGTEAAIKAKSDGYTVLMHVTSAGVTNPAVQSNLPYKWDQFTFIARTNTSPLVVIVKADSKWKTLKDLINDVEKNPSDFSYGTSGPGGPSTFGTAQIVSQAGIDPTKLNKVVFGGGAKTVAAVAGGHADFAVQNLSEVIELIKGGKLRGLAISNDKRVEALPDVPTAKEVGFDQFTFQGWNGVVGPPGLPGNVVKSWNEAIQKAMDDPEFTKKLKNQGLVPAYQGPEDFKAFLKNSYETALKIAKQTGIRK